MQSIVPCEQCRTSTTYCAACMERAFRAPVSETPPATVVRPERDSWDDRLGLVRPDPKWTGCPAVFSGERGKAAFQPCFRPLGHEGPHQGDGLYFQDHERYRWQEFVVTWGAARRPLPERDRKLQAVEGAGT